MRLLSILCLLLPIAVCSSFEQLPLNSAISVTDEHDGIVHPNTHDALVDLHRNLVEIESITGNENDVGKWLASYLRAQNLTVELQEAARGRYNVIAYPGKKRETKILVTSHIDTVRYHYSTRAWGSLTLSKGTPVFALRIEGKWH